MQATSGVILGLGAPGRTPLPIPDFVTEFFVGSVLSLATLLAVTARDKFGTADSVDLAATDAWATFQTGLALVNWLFGGQAVQRGGQARRGGPYPNTILKCKDGDYRLIAMTKREWVRFVHLMGDPDWAKEERFQDRIKMNELYSDELDRRVTEWLLQRTKQELFELCYEGGVPFTPINNFSDVLADRQMRARGVWEPLTVDGLAPLVGPRSPHGIANGESAAGVHAPTIGENNYEVFVDELGVVPGHSYQDLYHAGVI